jgi:HD superfamily phosphohydrolase
VAYGRFDHHRLIQTLKILPPPATPPNTEAAAEGVIVDPGESSVLELGVERGGLESAEALQLARYFMFSQVYFHRVRMIYDIHLKDFLAEWLAEEHGGVFPTDPTVLINLSDNEVMTALLFAARTEGAPGHEPARRIILRKHFKDFYRRRPGDVEIFAEAAKAIFEEAKIEFGAENVRYADGRKSGIPETFAVENDGQVVASTSLSDAFGNLPQPKGEFVYVAPELRTKAREWVEEHGPDIIQAAKAREQEDENEGEVEK